MNDEDLKETLEEFVSGLLRLAKCDHAGNCEMMSTILHGYLKMFWNMETEVVNCQVKQGRKRINHYYLRRKADSLIIDGTASQFVRPDGSPLPKIYIGVKPEFYLNP